MRILLRPFVTQRHYTINYKAYPSMHICFMYQIRNAYPSPSFCYTATPFLLLLVLLTMCPLTVHLFYYAANNQNDLKTYFSIAQLHKEAQCPLLWDLTSLPTLPKLYPQKSFEAGILSALAHKRKMVFWSHHRKVMNHGVWLKFSFFIYLST
jgi:hypothetical protein